MLCAQRRGDAVPRLFRDLAKGKTVEDTKALFASFKLALNLTWAFSGLPQCIPACLGLVGELRQLGISGPSQIDRYVQNSRRGAPVDLARVEVDLSLPGPLLPTQAGSRRARRPTERFIAL